MRALQLTSSFLAVLVLAAPLEGQRIRMQRDRIPAAELATYGDLTLTEVIIQARPQFFQPDHARIDFSLQHPWRVLIYVGAQAIGDSAVLRTYRAGQVQEVRYYRPNEANTRFGVDNASVIQLTLRPPPKP